MAPQLQQVDKLTIRFVVDNSIEWMTKLPPGFTHELRTHLTEHNPPIDDTTHTPLVDLPNFCCGAHGFSALLETQVADASTQLTLFDTGPDARAIARNLASLHIPTERVSRVVLSHWHADHSGGLLEFLRARAAAQAQQAHAERAPCVVDLHPDRPIARGISHAGHILGRLPDDPSFEQIEREGGVVETSRAGHVVAGGAVYVSGEIPRVTEFEGGILGGIKWVPGEGAAQGEWVKDELIMDERYALVDVLGKGLVIFSACSHAGIVNVVKDAIATFDRPVYMVVGGLHLAPPDLSERIAPTVDFLANRLRPAPAYVLPMHCSGFPAKVALEAALGEGCVPAGVGHKVEIEGNREAESMVRPPVVA